MSSHRPLRFLDASVRADEIRYLTADGQITDEANAVHTAALVACTYHCG